MYPSSGIPVRIEEPVFPHQMPGTVTVIPANVNVCPPVRQPRPIIEEVPNDWPGSKEFSSQVTSTEKVSSSAFIVNFVSPTVFLHD